MDMSVARLFRRMKTEYGLRCADEAAVMNIIKSYGDWRVMSNMREQLDERRRNDPPKPKPIELTLCD